MKTRFAPLLLFAGVWLAASGIASAGNDSPLETGWDQPPLEARTRAYWWWLNGYVTRESITRDLEEMKAKGFGGGIITDAGGAEQDGNDRVPHGPTFFSPEWRELYKHTLREADRLGLEMSLNIQSGWNLGGPMVPIADAAKKLVWSEAIVEGPTNLALTLPVPKLRDQYFGQVAVLAYPLRPGPATNRASLTHWQEKAIHKALHFSAPDTALLFDELPSAAGEQDARISDVVNLSRELKNGVLEWKVPPGKWQVLRFGYTVGDRSYVSTSSDGWKGYALDVLDEGAFRRYWDAVVAPLIADAGPLAGKTLRYLHTDSWEVEPLNWTPRYLEAFRKYRGYDALPWLPVLAGRIMNSRDESDRFLHDFRRTLGDLAVDGHYVPFRKWSHAAGLQFHPESGGPHAVPIDAQRCLGLNDVPMSEFWAWSWRHRVGDTNRFFVKQPAAAAHTYGRKLVAAEGFTTIGPHWQETIWDNLKPSFDFACTEGLNRMVWHAFVCSPAQAGMPGVQYFAGTHFNPNSTWWNKSLPFVTYMNRCQFMLQQGLFVADALYYYGDHVPNFAQLRSSDPARLGPGYDYDVVTEEIILSALQVKDGRLVLPDGMSYRALVLPNRTVISLEVLRKIQQLVANGATVIGPRPNRVSGLAHLNDTRELERIAGRLWGAAKAGSTVKGRVIDGKTAREVLLAEGTKPDFEFSSSRTGADLRYIHRRDGGCDIYFVASRGKEPVSAECTFRVAGKAPELWDPVSGERRLASRYSEAGGRTTVPLDLPPCGSLFVVFRHPPGAGPANGGSNAAVFTAVHQLSGPWTTAFDPAWGGPESAVFEQLVSWTDRPEPGIKYYSGTAVYRQAFNLPADLAGRSLWIDLGNVRELAEVKINGRSLGIAWAPPFRLEAAAALRSGTNLVEIEVVNFWPNRIIGDASLPREQQFTRTNIRKLTASTPLMPSGLLGPVRIVQRQNDGVSVPAVTRR